MRKTLALFLCLACVFLAGGALAKIGEGSLAGYYTIDPVTYSFQSKSLGKKSFTTATNHIFYSFHQADHEWESKPLFVMLNGGPGAGTVTNLFSMNTAPYTLDRQRQPQGSPGYSVNQYSWTELGNVLYLDAPATGFSYLTDPGTDNIETRLRMFFLNGNFNPYVDAAQMVRVVLKFLGDHREIKANQVILVGESYGGTRVSTMLNLLLFHPHYRDGGKLYRDSALVEEIEEHFQDIYGKDAELTPEAVARQFSRQILIQPELSGVYQDEVAGKMFYGEAPYNDPVIKNLARETGQSFPADPWWTKALGKAARVLIYYLPDKFKRDGYNYSQKSTWSSELEAYAAKSLRDVEALSTVLQYDVMDIEMMKSKYRDDAFRMIIGVHTNQGYLLEDGITADDEWMFDPAHQCYLPGNPDTRERLKAYAASQEYLENLIHQDLESLKTPLWDKLGTLHIWDGYLLEMNLAVYLAFTLDASAESGYEVNPDGSPIYGRMFLENLALVKTFLTDAEYDLVIYSPAIPEALKKYKDLVAEVTYARGKDLPDQNRGYFRVKYRENSLAHTATPDQVELYYPYYNISGHSVSSAQPGKFRDDVKAWLNCPEGVCD